MKVDRSRRAHLRDFVCCVVLFLGGTFGVRGLDLPTKQRAVAHESTAAPDRRRPLRSPGGRGRERRAPFSQAHLGRGRREETAGAEGAPAGLFARGTLVAGSVEGLLPSPSTPPAPLKSLTFVSSGTGSRGLE